MAPLLESTSIPFGRPATENVGAGQPVDETTPFSPSTGKSTNHVWGKPVTIGVDGAPFTVRLTSSDDTAEPTPLDAVNVNV
jgi:hypothetical protein